ncbi:MAG: hypothetical protein B6D61_07595 [Bacteroidetes bacterium 4484_249]|nr:MAG: hypothetical protein B6D61_07595 [Bacteroidetes bacterium 4484_249]
MKQFNTSGPNIPSKHYTIERIEIIKKGVELIRDERYFTIWAPRQTGKSTYFRQLSEKLNEMDYTPVFFSTEGFDDYTIADTFDTLCREIKKQQNILWHIETLKEFEKIISNCTDKKLVIIIDEIEGLNPKIFGQFLHTIRNLYHTRYSHCLKSIILVGVSNVVGVVSDNASPFNISDNLNVPYFTEDEIHELLQQHEEETGQLFNEKVKEKIYQITAGQPGLVNGFAKVMVENNPDKKLLTLNDYLKVEDWYLRIAIDKNFANILNKAKDERPFVERLLFTEDKIPFNIDRESIKLLHTNGLIKDDGEGYVTFWVPFYKKRLYSAFYPYSNGEQKQISRTVLAEDYFTDRGEFIIEKLINSYKEYVKRRGFKVFMEKDENGNYKSLKEAALMYSFETFITSVMQELNGKIYREADTGLGKSDMIINIANQEKLIETKIYYSPGKFTNGKKQLAYYCQSLGLAKGIYIVFCPKGIKYPEAVKEQKESIETTGSPGQAVEVSTYLIEYDEEKW